MNALEAYEDITLPGEIPFLHKLAEKVRGVGCLHVNSTRVGGGVAEMLERIMPMMQELGIRPRWEVIQGHDAFYGITKTFHNTLQGSPGTIGPEDAEIWRQCNVENAKAKATAPIRRSSM